MAFALHHSSEYPYRWKEEWWPHIEIDAKLICQNSERHGACCVCSMRIVLHSYAHLECWIYNFNFWHRISNSPKIVAKCTAASSMISTGIQWHTVDCMWTRSVCVLVGMIDTAGNATQYPDLSCDSKHGSGYVPVIQLLLVCTPFVHITFHYHIRLYRRLAQIEAPVLQNEPICAYSRHGYNNIRIFLVGNRQKYGRKTKIIFSQSMTAKTSNIRIFFHFIFGIRFVCFVSHRVRRKEYLYAVSGRVRFPRTSLRKQGARWIFLRQLRCSSRRSINIRRNKSIYEKLISPDDFWWRVSAECNNLYASST